MRLWFPFILLLGLARPFGARAAASDSAEADYQSARKEYYKLKGDSAKRKFRHHWLHVAHQFEAVAGKHPRSQRAPDALFTAGELLQELSRISRVQEDLDAALADYRRLCERHPSHHLADDAALALGRIYFERLDQPETARRVLAEGIKQNPKGDRLRAIRSLLASVDRELARRDARTHSSTGQHEALQRRIAMALAVKGNEETETERKAETAEPRPDRESPDEGHPQRADEEQTDRPPSPSLSPRSKPLPLRSSSLKIRRVVIDAGHGGHDTGAIGRGGTLEKDVSLAIARRLSRMLSSAGLQVTLTRDDDVFVSLEDRVRLANEAEGDLFVSIHCNSAPGPRLRGVETYTLNTSSNRYAIRLAARENAAPEKQISNLQFILADLATKADVDQSVGLAQRVQHSLVTHLRAKYGDARDLGIKQALFYVLLGVKMPAVLVETSFLSNREEEKRLGSRAYQDDVAMAIASGVREFLGDRQRVAERN